MKKNVSLFLIIIIVLSLTITGCSGGKDTLGNSVEQKADGEKYTLRIGLVLDESNPHTIAINETFKPYVEKKTNGNVTVEVYPNSQLGDDRQTVEAVALGTLEMSAPSSATLTSFDSNVQVLDLPYLFTSAESARKALDSELGDALKESLKTKGITLLGFGDAGFRNLSNSKHPVYTPKDMVGLKLRVMENPMYIQTFKLLGSNPTPMAFSELYTALQQKTVDGQDNPIIITYTSRLHEPQKYYSLIEHAYNINSYVISTSIYESMPKEYQEIIQEAVNESVIHQRALVDGIESEYLDKMEDYGTEVNKVTPEQKELFVDAVKPVHDGYIKDNGDELYNKAIKYNK